MHLDAPETESRRVGPFYASKSQRQKRGKQGFHNLGRGLYVRTRSMVERVNNFVEKLDVKLFVKVQDALHGQGANVGRDLSVNRRRLLHERERGGRQRNSTSAGSRAGVSRGQTRSERPRWRQQARDGKEGGSLLLLLCRRMEKAGSEGTRGQGRTARTGTSG
jgi:hypothetical protein